MTPDPATIARRRHLVTMLVRSGIALYAVWVAVELVRAMGYAANDLLQGGLAVSVGVLIQVFALNVPQVALVAVLVFCEARLVRWIVPLPPTEPACPKCGYSLKNLNSPVCPECGTNLRSAPR